MQKPRILTVEKKNLVGLMIHTNLQENKTAALWKEFMTRRVEIKKRTEGRFYSVEVYEPDLRFEEFSYLSYFDKWAVIEVEEITELPSGMQLLTIPTGLYAVFIHRGISSNFQYTSTFIHKVWMPNSKYKLDNRPHFEIMAEKYKGPNHPKSEEEVYVPIKLR